MEGTESAVFASHKDTSLSLAEGKIAITSFLGEVYEAIFERTVFNVDLEQFRIREDLFSLAREIASENKIAKPEGAAKKAIAELVRLGFIEKWCDPETFYRPASSLLGECYEREVSDWIVFERKFEIKMGGLEMEEVEEVEAATIKEVVEEEKLEPWKILLQEAQKTKNLRINGATRIWREYGFEPSNPTHILERLEKAGKLTRNGRYVWTISVNDEETLAFFSQLPEESRKSKARIAEVLAEKRGYPILAKAIELSIDRLIRKGSIINTGGPRSLALYQAQTVESADEGDQPLEVFASCSLDLPTDPILAQLEDRLAKAKEAVKTLEAAKRDYLAAIQKVTKVLR